LVDTLSMEMLTVSADTDPRVMKAVKNVELDGIAKDMLAEELPGSTNDSPSLKKRSCICMGIDSGMPKLIEGIIPLGG